jgi:hypothetical protein
METETDNFLSSSTLTWAQPQDQYYKFNFRDFLHLKYYPYVKMLVSIYECTLGIDDSS